MRELDVVGVRVEMPSNAPMVLLREVGGSRFLPIWIGANEASAIARDAAAPAGLRLVVVDSSPDDRFGVVGSDHESGAFAATHHLLAGRETVWHVAGPEDSFAAAARERGWRGACPRRVSWKR